MDATQRAALMDATEAAFRSQGIDMYQQAPRLLGFLDKCRPHIECCRSRQEFDSYLASIGEEQQAEAAQLLALVTALPQLIGQLVQHSIHETAASTPKPSGPKVKLTPDARRQIVERVGMLHISGVRLGTAQTRAGQQFGVSKRTVQAAWQKRQQFSEQPFQSMTDVWQFLKRESGV